jgi:hypothetical protein
MAAPAAGLQCCCRFHPLSKLQGQPQKPLGVLDGQLQVSREPAAHTQRAGEAQTRAGSSQASARAPAAGSAAAAAPGAAGRESSDAGTNPGFITGDEICNADSWLAGDVHVLVLGCTSRSWHCPLPPPMLLFCLLRVPAALQAAVESSTQDAAEQSGEQNLFKQELHETQTQVRRQSRSMAAHPQHNAPRHTPTCTASAQSAYPHSSAHNALNTCACLDATTLEC